MNQESNNIQNDNQEQNASFLENDNSEVLSTNTGDIFNTNSEVISTPKPVAERPENIGIVSYNEPDKKEDNVPIKNDKLKEVEINYTPPSKGKIFLLVVFFILLIGFVIFLPDISKMIEERKCEYIIRMILSILFIPVLILVHLYVIIKFDIDKKKELVFDDSEINEEKILMEEERERKWKEEWWHKHYILRFLYNLPPRDIMTNR